MIKIRRLNKKLVLLIFLNFIIRLPSLFNSLDPYIFCDELLLWDEAKRMFQEKTLIMKWFKQGPVNLYPVVLPLFPLELVVNIFDKSLYSTIVIPFARFIFNFLLSSATIVYLLKINRLINLTKGKNADFILGILFLFNPYFLAQTRIWYPNSYLYFFTTLLTYFILKIYYGNIDYRNLALISLIFALGVSVKYNFIFFGLSLVILYLVKVRQEDKFFLKEVLFSSTGFVLAVAILNFSAILNFELFLSDFTGNIENYGTVTSENFISRFLYYFLFLFAVPVSSIGFIFLLINLRILLKTKEYFLISLFYIFPLIFIFYFSMFPTFVNRNINLFVPFVLICLNLGIDQVFVIKTTRLANSLKGLLSIFSLIYLISFSITIYDDLKTDSRVSTHNWLSERPEFFDVKVGVPYSCSGASPAENISWLIKDPYGEEKLEYYVLEDYWPNAFFDYQERSNILFVMNHKDNHFDYFSNLRFFNNRSKYELSLYENSNYSLIKTFSGNGPDVHIFKKNN
jgi:4-amino-4-deoxy-L-arabinose transferase-like glycosyltransferase